MKQFKAKEIALVLLMIMEEKAYLKLKKRKKSGYLNLTLELFMLNFQF